MKCLVLMAVLALAACSKNSNSLGPTSSAPFSATDLVVGIGTVAVAGQSITVSYQGFLLDSGKPEGKGSSFDSSSSFRFTLGSGQVIRGWDQGILGMRVGGQRRLIIPPELAYGSQTPDPKKIPPNATLLFDITLVSVP